MQTSAEPQPSAGARLAATARSYRSSTGGPLAPVAGLYAGLAALVVLLNHPALYVADNRFEEYWSPGSRLLHQVFIWDGTRDLGGVREELWPSTLFVAVLRAFGLSPGWTVHLWHALLIVVAGLGVVVLLRSLRGRIDGLAVVAGIAYMFGPFSASFLVPSALYLSFVIAPWVLANFLRGVRALEPSGGDGAVADRPAIPAVWPTAAAFALLVAVVGTTDPPGLFYLMVFLGPAAVYVVHVERSARWRSVVGWLVRAGVLSLLTCAAALAKVLIGAGSYADRLAYTESPRVVNVASSWAEAFRGLGFWLTYFRDESGLARPQGAVYLHNPVVIAAMFGLPILAMLGLARSRWRPRLLFAGVAVTSLVLLVGAYPVNAPSPYGRALLALYERVPWTGGLRTTFKAGSGLAMGVAVLVAVAASRPRNGTRLAAVGMSFLAGLAIVVGAVPFWSGGLYSPKASVTDVPNYWRDALDWLDTRPDRGRVLVLPGSTVTPYRWGFPGDDIFDALLRRPHAAASALRSSSAVASDLLDTLMTRTGGTYVTGTFAPMARRLGISYVVIRNDTDWQRSGAPRPAAFDELRKDPDLTLAARFGAAGQNTVAASDRSLAVFNEVRLTPVEVYRVRDPRQAVRVEPDVPPLLVSGSGAAWPQLASRGLLRTDAGVRYTGQLDALAMTHWLAKGSALYVTDTNRRRLTLLRGTSSTSSHTLAAGENLEDGREAQDLFNVAGSQSVATYQAARRISATPIETLGGFVPWQRPANAFDGDPATSWLTGGLAAHPEGARIRVDLAKPARIGAVRLVRSPWVAPGRRVTGVELTLSDGSVISTQLNRDRGTVPLRPRTVSWFEVRITAVEGEGLDPVGFAEIAVPGLDLREYIRMPDDVFRAAAASLPVRRALQAAPVSYQMRREPGSGLVDEETSIRRIFRTAGDRLFHATGQFHVGATTPDEVLDSFLGDPVGAYGSSRSGGGLDNRGGLAVDGRLDTGWNASAEPGQRLTVRFPERAVGVVKVKAAHGGDLFSRVREVTVSMGDQLHLVELHPVDCGTDGGPSLPTCHDEGAANFEVATASRLTVDLTGVEPVTTDFGAKPISVLEVEFAGANHAAPPPEQGLTGCTSDLVSVDGDVLPVRILASRGEVLSGQRLPYTACADTPLRTGEHRLVSTPAADTVVLDAVGSPTPRVTPSVPRPVVVERISPTRLRIDVTTDGPAVLTTGESFDRGWKATEHGRSLGRATSVDTQSAWRIPSAGRHQVDLEFAPQRAFSGALALSAVGAALCAALLLHGRRR